MCICLGDFTGAFWGLPWKTAQTSVITRLPASVSLFSFFFPSLIFSISQSPGHTKSRTLPLFSGFTTKHEYPKPSKFSKEQSSFYLIASPAFEHTCYLGRTSRHSWFAVSLCFALAQFLKHLTVFCICGFPIMCDTAKQMWPRRSLLDVSLSLHSLYTCLGNSQFLWGTS